MGQLIKISSEFFEKSDYWGYFKQTYRRFGLRALDKQFRNSVRRPYSRSLIPKYSPSGVGIEIGVGDRSISPASRTVLTDGFAVHDNNRSLAKLIFDAAQIPFADETFQFLISEHALEHVPNPIKMLHEWKRVLQPKGVLFLFLPHKGRTFDQLRPRTTLEHLIIDFKNDPQLGDDPEHFREWMELVIERGLAPHYSAMSQSEMLSQACVHLHVWETQDVVELLKYCGFEVLFSADEVPDRTDSFVVVAQK